MATPSNTTNSTPTLRLYLRRSLDGDTQAASFDTQRSLCARRAEREGWSWQERKEYTDDDRSGGDSTREQWNLLLQEAQPGDVVLAYSRDRLSREDPIEAARIMRDLVKRGVRVCYADGTEETFKSAIDSVMAVIKGFGAAHELERIKGRVRDALRERVRDGYAAGAVVYGWTTVPDEATRRVRRDQTIAFKKRIVVDTHAAPIVRRVWAEYADGKGLKAIAVGLTRDSILSPAGKAWSVPAIWALLRREEYRGVIVYGRAKTERRGDKRIRFESDAPVIRIERPDLRIVDDHTWERVQERIATRRKQPGGRRPVKYPLVGILKCPLCKGAMVAHVSHRKGGKVVRGYICWQHRVRGDEGCPMRHRFPGDRIDECVFNYVHDVTVSAAIDIVREAIREELARRTERPTNVSAIEAEIAEAKQAKARAIKLAIATEGDPDVAEQIKKLSQRISTLEKAMAVATAPTDELALRRVEEGAVRRLGELRQHLVAKGGGVARDALRKLGVHSLLVEKDGDHYTIRGEAELDAVSLSNDPTGRR